MGDMYTSGEYGRRNPGWHDEDAHHKAMALGVALNKWALRPQSVLDVGCGTGGVLLALRSHFAPTVRLEGWDIAAAAIADARPRGAGRVHFFAGDALADARAADLVLLLDVFEHVPDDLGFLSDLRDLGTNFVFRIPLERSVWDDLHPARTKVRREQWGHLHRYDRVGALALLHRAGFVVREDCYTRVPPDISMGGGFLSDVIRRMGFGIRPHAAVRWMGGYSLLVWASKR